jgi:dihydropteroate synthase
MKKSFHSPHHPGLSFLGLASDRTLVMGVLNVTPDSFSDGGKWMHRDAAIEAGLRMVEAGADIVDVGGESTRPKGLHYGSGADSISLQEELNRVIPVIQGLHERGVPCISIDTWKSSVASQALDAGAALVNDVSGLQMDPALGEVVARAGVPIVLMHMRGTPETTMDFADSFSDVVTDVCAELMGAVKRALDAGISKECIVLDPGLGFGKRGDDNYALMGRVRELQDLGFPVLMGASRKSFLGDLIGKKEPGLRDWATAATVAGAVLSGVNVVRVHHVEGMVDVVRVSQKLAEF